MAEDKLRHARSTVAAATWSAPDTGVVYGRMVLDATALQLWTSQVEKAWNVVVEPEHAMVGAVGRVLVAAPGLNRVIRLGRATPRNGVSVTVVTRGRHRRVDDADVVEIPLLVETANTPNDEAAWAQTDRTLGRVPAPLLRPVMRLLGFLGRMGMAVPGLGIEPGAAGAAIVERGAGFDLQLMPQAAHVATTLHLVVGPVVDRVVAHNGVPTVRPTITVDVTVDARLCANDELEILADVLRETVADPWTLGVVERPRTIEARSR